MQILHGIRIKKIICKKEEKNVNMAEKLALSRSTTTRNHTFTFPIYPRLILQDLVKKGLLKPLERKVRMKVFPCVNICKDRKSHPKRKCNSTTRMREKMKSSN